MQALGAPFFVPTPPPNPEPEPPPLSPSLPHPCNAADMEFVEGESQADREPKLRVLEIYNLRLEQREKRRVAVRQMGLLSRQTLQVGLGWESGWQADGAAEQADAAGGVGVAGRRGR